MFYLAGLLLFAVAAFAIWRAFQSPKFVAGLSFIFVKALWPQFLKAIHPKDLTQKQKDMIARGENPFTIQPFGRQQEH